MARSGKVCIELNFTRGGEGRSRREKIKSFWEFIDARKDLVPFHPSQDIFRNSATKTGNPESIMNSSNDQREATSTLSIPSQKSPEKDSRSDNSDVCSNRADKSPTTKSIWIEELRIFKDLGLDRVALAASNKCKRCLRDERNNALMEKELQFADSVPESYQELDADLQAFQERVKHQKPKFVYKDPGKYAHLIQ